MCVYKRENNRERLKLFGLWNSYIWRKILSFACSLLFFPSSSLVIFGLHSSPFIAKSGETRWQGVAFLLEKDNGE
jgi:hypothetical protein